MGLFLQPIALNEVPVIAALEPFGILDYLLMTQSFATASDIAPYCYTGLLFAIIFGFVLLGETQGLLALMRQLSLLRRDYMFGNASGRHRHRTPIFNSIQSSGTKRHRLENNAIIGLLVLIKLVTLPMPQSDDGRLS